MLAFDIEAALAPFMESIAPRPVISVADWADGNRVLSGKAAAEPGPWRTMRTPYLREPMEALTDPDIEEVVLWFGTQLGKSECCNNWIGYSIDYNPGPVLMVQPTLVLAKRYSKQRLAAMIESTSVLSRKVRPAWKGSRGNTLLEKEYEGGILIVAGATKMSGLASMPIRDIMFDEIDSYESSDEGDPISAAEKRQDTFAQRKRLKTSTCTIKGESRIEQAYAASDRRKYFLPCPHCGEFQILVWRNLKWDEGDPSSARYVCEFCGTLIEETAKPKMLAAGEWRAECANPRVRGYWLSSFYSPLGWLSWAGIVREHIDAKIVSDAGDQTKMQVWTNTRLAETWELYGNRVAESEIQRRAEPYELGTVPAGVLVLTAAVDVQGDRLELAIFGWGRDEECWWLDYRKIYGDPAEDLVWQTLDDELKTPLVNAAGVDMRIFACAIDHGGHHAGRVEWFVRTRQGRHVFAVKGQSQANKPIIAKPQERDTTWKGKKLKAGVRVWPVGSDTGKRALYERLALTRPGPRYIHTSTGLDDEFYRGLTAEQLVTRYVRGRARSTWELRKGRRNEPLDLWVYGYAAAVYLGIPTWRKAKWAELAAAAGEGAETLTPINEPPAPPPDAKPWARPLLSAGRGGGFVTGWRGGR